MPPGWFLATLEFNVVEGKHAVDINHRHFGGIAVRSNDLWAAPNGKAAFNIKVEVVALYLATFTRDNKAIVRRSDACNRILRWRTALKAHVLVGRELGEKLGMGGKSASFPQEG